MLIVPEQSMLPKQPVILPPVVPNQSMLWLYGGGFYAEHWGDENGGNAFLWAADDVDSLWKLAVRCIPSSQASYAIYGQPA